MRELFELCGADRELLFSPYCWRVRLALAHKGLDWQSRPIHFTDKEAIAFSGQKLVPVLTSGGVPRRFWISQRMRLPAHSLR